MTSIKKIDIKLQPAQIRITLPFFQSRVAAGFL